ncbi:MAG: hypothetical protein N2203_03540, partial [Bacteroidia bacterium]|nr:hypothetical protein [Bacteroidia bacterium]
MFKLSHNWLTEGMMDAEYKQYLLLAYLRDIHEVFEHRILYPPFAELIQHHRNLLKIKHNLQNIKEYHAELKGIDWQNMKLIYTSQPESESGQTPNKTDMEIIEEIIDFSIPKMEDELEHGKKIFDEIEKKLKYTTVGISPLDKSIGYLFIQNYPDHEFCVYKYEISSIYSEIDNEKVAFKGLKTEYLATYTLNLSKSLTSIKQEII